MKKFLAASASSVIVFATIAMAAPQPIEDNFSGKSESEFQANCENGGGSFASGVGAGGVPTLDCFGWCPDGMSLGCVTDPGAHEYDVIAQDVDNDGVYGEGGGNDDLCWQGPNDENAICE